MLFPSDYSGSGSLLRGDEVQAFWGKSSVVPAPHCWLRSRCTPRVFVLALAHTQVAWWLFSAGAAKLIVQGALSYF